MRKLIAFILSLFIATVGYAQDYNKYRMTDKQKSQLIRTGKSHFVVIEQFLDKNEEAINENALLVDSRRLTNLLDPTPYVNNLKKENIKKICTDCYLAEYNAQVEKQNKIIFTLESKEKHLRAEKDSIRRVKQQNVDSLLEASRLKRIEENNPKPLEKTYKNRNPYDDYIMSMEMSGKNQMGHRYLTAFCDIDLDLASNRLGLYLQDNGLTYADDDYINTGRKITYKFRPQVSTKNEYMNITYSYTEDKALLSYVTAVTGSYSPCYPIKSVEIIGTKHLVLSLYISYWGLSNLKIGGYKGNETSYNECMGDYIAYTPINNRTAKITITKREGVEMNYYKNYKIE